MKRNFCILTYFMVFISCPALAATFTEAFTSTSLIETSNSTAVVNLFQGRVHPNLQVTGWDEDATLPRKTRNLDVGDGSDGVFDDTAYNRFDDGGNLTDKIIEINTDNRRTLNFTSFRLDATWTIRPTGSRPLDIRSQSTMQIDGIIDCSGDAGHALLAVDSSAVARATGRCNGGRGGAGGSTASTALNGLESGANTAGVGLAATAIGNGGGGGGAYSQNATPAGDGIAFGGGAWGGKGSNQQDDGFTVDGGGAGGGGGNYYDIGAVGARTSGGGGGAGGGVIYLTSIGNITVGATGAIRANGGAGGGTAGTGNGGGGGGGGGGSIAIMTAGSVIIDGAVTATGGAGATTDGGDGGAGATGRTWITDNDAVPGGGVMESPTSLLAFPGSVRYRTGSFTVVSRLFDTINSNPTYSGSSVTSVATGGSSASLEAAASDAEFTSASASWASDITTLSGGRYFRYRLTLNSVDEVTPATVSLIRIDYLRTSRDEYDFQAGCATLRSNTPAPPSGQVAFALAMLLPLLMISTMRRRFAVVKKSAYQR